MQPCLEPLLKQNINGSFEPRLATGWIVAEDGSSVTFALRQGVKFHDGTDFDAQAVKWNFDLEILKELETLGCKVVKQTHVLSGLDRSFSNKFGGVSHAELLSESLRCLFGVGIKVAIECTVMAADSGNITIDKTIAVGGTAAKGKGADCAIVALPAHANNFFDFRVLEILAKPFKRD